MKLRKITNVSIEVCSGEQMVAYNYASAYKSWGYETATKMITTGIEDKTFNKFNREMILQAFHNGYKKYETSGKSILLSYEEIGKTFYIN